MSALIFEDALRASRAYNLIYGDLKLGLGHAYLIVSPDDDALEQFFTLIAATIYCENKNACMDCAECRKTLNGNQPDLYFVNRQHEKIKVGDIREMLEGAEIRPIAERKLYFIERADLMTTEAQNKLLKTLEEPPERVTFFLGAANESGLLDTVRSRCRRINIDIFGADAINDALRSIGVDAELCSIAAACAEGQLGKAYKIAMSPEYAELYKTALASLKELKKSSDILKIEQKPAILKNFKEYLDALSVILRDVMAAKADKSLVLSKRFLTDIESLSGQYSERALAEIIFAVNETRKKLSLNVNQSAAADSLYFSILEDRFRWQ